MERIAKIKKHVVVIDDETYDVLFKKQCELIGKFETYVSMKDIACIGLQSIIGCIDITCESDGSLVLYIETDGMVKQ